ncbi:hypothetical protein BCR34DRAFT_591740 [Clohesyomyces aquaticus]|uniref:Uncharacterized protein n=1 Tax=Clohesyomyces aquaticus TaxID=1231657 RepID=A0A1Y1YYA6_9PLEO|nr:hypothetical protein BCR34DRAFT_591740 [Clohesyomyces aquaticus]
MACFIHPPHALANQPHPFPRKNIPRGSRTGRPVLAPSCSHALPGAERCQPVCHGCLRPDRTGQAFCLRTVPCPYCLPICPANNLLCKATQKSLTPFVGPDMGFLWRLPTRSSTPSPRTTTAASCTAASTQKIGFRKSIRPDPCHVLLRYSVFSSRPMPSANEEPKMQAGFQALPMFNRSRFHALSCCAQQVSNETRYPASRICPLFRCERIRSASQRSAAQSYKVAFADVAAVGSSF